MPPAVDVAPASADVSESVPPTVIVELDRVVAIVTPTGLTVRGSHPLVARLLLASPE